MTVVSAEARAREAAVPTPVQLPILEEAGRRVLYEQVLAAWRRTQADAVHSSQTRARIRAFHSWIRRYEGLVGPLVFCQRCGRPYRTATGVIHNPHGMGYICRPTCGFWPAVIRERGRS